MAKIDDSLFRQRKEREGIIRLLKDFKDAIRPLEELSIFKEQLEGYSKNFPRHLLDIMLEEEDTELASIALLVLMECATPQVFKKAQNMLDSQKLTTEQYARLTLLMSSNPEAKLPKTPKETNQMFTKLLDSLNIFTEEIGSIEIGEIWLKEYHSLPVKERLPMLEIFFASNSPVYIPIYAVELGAPQVTITRCVADRASTLPYEDTLLMLKSFPDVPDTSTRIAIQQSIKALEEKQRMGELQPRNPRNILKFYKAYVAEQDLAGFLSVIFSKKQPDGTIRFLVTLIDRLDEGITDCFGDIAETTSEFHSLFNLLEQQSALALYTEAKRDYTVWLLTKAEELTIGNGYTLPPEYLLWRHLLWDEKPPHRNYGVKFGLYCCECGEPIRQLKKKSNVWVIGDIALCPGCIKKKTHCENCGRPIDPEKSYALASPDQNHITIICARCYKTARRKKKPSRKK